jgi:hypothetical protein
MKKFEASLRAVPATPANDED